MKSLPIFMYLLISLAGCNDKKIDKKTEEEKLMQTSREWSKAAASGDVEQTMQYWADDAVVISAGQPVLMGREAIRNMVEGSNKMPGFRISWEPQSAVISEKGDMGYLIENTSMSMQDSTGNSTNQQFKAVTIWKKQADGSWKNVVDVMSPLPQ